MVKIQAARKQFKLAAEKPQEIQPSSCTQTKTDLQLHASQQISKQQGTSVSQEPHSQLKRCAGWYHYNYSAAYTHTFAILTDDIVYREEKSTLRNMCGVYY